VEAAPYFDRIDGRVDTWWFSTLPAEARGTDKPLRTPRFHRALSEWVEMICQAGLLIERFVDPSADATLAEAEPVVAHTHVVPISLLLCVQKPLRPVTVDATVKSGCLRCQQCAVRN
jgi:hypothetical protein